MISFIVIGRNEGWKITKCFKSIYDTISENSISDYEIIYIDSNSIDDSIERVKKFNKVSIYKLTLEFNPAIARNLGVEKSKGTALYFIDGDMEIQPEFLPLVYSENLGLKYPFVSGQLQNFNYDENGDYINSTWQYNGVLSKDDYFISSGGIFLIERKVWELAEGMDNRFIRGEDLDISLRLTKNGNRIFRKKDIIAKHHTVSYQHHSRIWKTISSGDIKFANSLLLRKQFQNKYAYIKIFRNFYTLLVLLFLGIIVALTNHYYLITAYLLIIGARTFRSRPRRFFNFINLSTYFIVRDLLFICYLFFPLKKICQKDIKYQIINDN